MIGVKRFRTGRSRGFTLMEMLVALGIFSVVMVSATEIYIMAGRGQRKAFNLEKVQSDARFTVEAITREVRTGEIDYRYYAARATPLAVPDTELVLIAADDTKIRFFLSDDTNSGFCPDAVSVPCLLVAVGLASPASVTPSGVAVQNLKFYLSPLVDPFLYDPTIHGYGSNQQPIVTVVLYLKSTGGRQAEQATVMLQTTATSRIYRR